MRAQADLYSTMAENSLNSTLMIAQLIEKMAANSGQTDSPWFGVVREALEKVIEQGARIVNLQKAQFEQNAGIPGQQVAQQPAQQQQQQQQMTPGQALAAQIMRSLPPDMQTNDWYMLLAMLHDAHDVSQTAEYAANLLTQLEDQGKIPEIIRADYERDYTETLAKLIGMLPITQMNKPYADKFVETLVELLATEEEEEEGTPEAAPAPAPTAAPAQAPAPAQGEEQVINIGSQQFDAFKKEQRASTKQKGKQPVAAG